MELKLQISLKIYKKKLRFYLKKVYKWSKVFEKMHGDYKTSSTIAHWLIEYDYMIVKKCNRFKYNYYFENML